MRWKCPRIPLDRGAANVRVRHPRDCGRALARLPLRPQAVPRFPPGPAQPHGAKDGGYLRPHRSHQSGRDADIGLFYRGDRFLPRGAPRERLIDPARKLGADPGAHLRNGRAADPGRSRHPGRPAQAGARHRRGPPLALAGLRGLVKHARRHRDHFHVRFYAPRAQELGRRIQPLLALRPDQNRTVHVVRTGNTLTQIATKYKTSSPRCERRMGSRHGRCSSSDSSWWSRCAGCAPAARCPSGGRSPRFAPPEPLPSVESWQGGINPEMATAE